jgi:hypothetical protein
VEWDEFGRSQCGFFVCQRARRVGKLGDVGSSGRVFIPEDFGWIAVVGNSRVCVGFFWCWRDISLIREGLEMRRLPYSAIGYFSLSSRAEPRGYNNTGPYTRTTLLVKLRLYHHFLFHRCCNTRAASSVCLHYTKSRILFSGEGKSVLAALKWRG